MKLKTWVAAAALAVAAGFSVPADAQEKKVRLQLAGAFSTMKN